MPPISIAAQVHPSGNPLFISAGKKLARCLGEAAGSLWPVKLYLSPPGGEITVPQTVVVACPGWPEAERVHEPLAETEIRWRDHVKTLKATGAAVSICTIFRHVAQRSGPGTPSPVLERIRRLNRLAIELSHELDLGVIDIDRAFAHTGAQNLHTDYRLSGEMAVEFAGHTIALNLLSCGLEDVVDPDVLEKARNTLGGLHELIGKHLGATTGYAPPGSPVHG